jgi:hypothetical protein
MQNVEVALRPSADTFAELDVTLSRLASGRSELGREWLTLAPHYLQRNALQIPKSHFSIFERELAIRPFGNIAIEQRVIPSESGFRKHELLLVRHANSWKAVVVFAKYSQKRKKKKRIKGKKQRATLSFVSGGLPSLGKRR